MHNSRIDCYRCGLLVKVQMTTAHLNGNSAEFLIYMKLTRNHCYREKQSLCCLIVQCYYGALIIIFYKASLSSLLA